MTADPRHTEPGDQTEPPSLILKDVNLKLGENQIIVNANASVECGEYVAITGRSGSGKSTLLNLIAGNRVPDSGAIEIRGRNIARRAERTAAQKQEIGYVYQTSQLVHWMTALDNVMLGMQYQGVRPPERRRRAEHALASVSLSDRMQHRPHQLSGGERQRVSLARAIARRPSLLLADEPTGNLDETTGEEIVSLIEMMRTSAAVILVTHDSALAARAGRRWMLDSGRLIEVPVV